MGYRVAGGGLGVIAAPLLTYPYPVFVVIPLCRDITFEIVTCLMVPGPVEDLTLRLTIEQHGTFGVRFTGSGRAILFRLDREVITEERDPNDVGSRSYNVSGMPSGVRHFSAAVVGDRGSDSHHNPHPQLTPRVVSNCWPGIRRPWKTTNV